MTSRRLERQHQRQKLGRGPYRCLVILSLRISILLVLLSRTLVHDIGLRMKFMRSHEISGSMSSKLIMALKV